MAEVAPIHYRIVPADPDAHRFEVRCTIPEPDPAGQVVSLPAWIPGSYLIRDFAKHVIRLSAECAGASVAVRKLDKATWRCEPCSGPLTVTSDVYAWDLSVRGAHLDATHGYFNGTSVFLMVHGRERRPCRVEILPPIGDRFRHWRVATAMTRDNAQPYGFGTYRADHYEELIDHPVEMGTFTLIAFDAGGVPHDIILTGRHRADLDRLTADLKVVCEQHLRFFGAPAPMERYLFLITVVGEGYGGLEHRASSSLLCSRDDLPRQGSAEIEGRYRTLLALASHEYFHTWNVKRIKPQAFAPYDLSRETYTHLLWVFEGVTSYYDALALVRSGLITQESYLELLGQAVTHFMRGRGRLKQTLEDASFDAWIKFYKPDENTPNASVSYYTKGSLVALALDLTIRHATDGTRSLDDVMRALWERYGNGSTGVPEDGMERIAQEVAGVDLRAFFDQAVRSTEDLALEPLLAHVGVACSFRPAESQDDKGGTPGSAKKTAAPRSWLGVRVIEHGAEAKLAHVLDHGPAHVAGLAAGDVLVAIDGIRATRANIQSLLDAHPTPGAVVVYAFRRDELMEFHVALQPPPADTCFLTLKPDSDDATRARRAAWLGSGA